MSDNFNRFLDSIESPNTVKVAKTMKQIGEYDYTDCSVALLENVILSMKPNSPRAITTICYIMGLYGKFIGQNDMYHMIQDLDRSVIWKMAKPNAPKRFISHKTFEEVCHEVGVYEDYNAFYKQVLFRCVYEGIYNDDMSVIKNLRASDIDGNIVTLRDDGENTHKLEISESLAEDLKELGTLDVWERKNRYGTIQIHIDGLYHDCCFKLENRGGKDDVYKFAYYRILREIAKEYVGYSLVAQHLFISGIMHRICENMKANDIDYIEAFSDHNRDRFVGKIISDELKRCNYNIEVRNFREIVKGHLEVFEI